MRTIICLTAALALAGCKQAEAPAADNAAEVTNTAEAAPAATLASLNETTWTYTREGKNITESIDAKGNYIANAGAEHVDHGTMAMVDGKACFTSAMDKEGPTCWTVKDTPVGGTEETVSDKGEKLMVTRAEYAPMTM